LPPLSGRTDGSVPAAAQTRIDLSATQSGRTRQQTETAQRVRLLIDQRSIHRAGQVSLEGILSGADSESIKPKLACGFSIPAVAIRQQLQKGNKLLNLRFGSRDTPNRGSARARRLHLDGRLTGSAGQDPRPALARHVTLRGPACHHLPVGDLLTAEHMIAH
jgi:hypothetical protein